MNKEELESSYEIIHSVVLLDEGTGKLFDRVYFKDQGDICFLDFDNDEPYKPIGIISLASEIEVEDE